MTHAPTGAALVMPAWNEPEAIGAVLDEVPPLLVDEIAAVVESTTHRTTLGRAAYPRSHRSRGHLPVTRPPVGLFIPAWNEPESIRAVLDHVPPQLIDQIQVAVSTAVCPTNVVAPNDRARVEAEAFVQ